MDRPILKGKTDVWMGFKIFSIAFVLFLKSFFILLVYQKVKAKRNFLKPNGSFTISEP